MLVLLVKELLLFLSVSRSGSTPGEIPLGMLSFVIFSVQTLLKWDLAFILSGSINYVTWNNRVDVIDLFPPSCFWLCSPSRNACFSARYCEIVEKTSTWYSTLHLCLIVSLRLKYFYEFSSEKYHSFESSTCVIVNMQEIPILKNMTFLVTFLFQLN